MEIKTMKVLFWERLNYELVSLDKEHQFNFYSKPDFDISPVALISGVTLNKGDRVIYLGNKRNKCSAGFEIIDLKKGYEYRYEGLFTDLHGSNLCFSLYENGEKVNLGKYSYLGWNLLDDGRLHFTSRFHSSRVVLCDVMKKAV